MARQRCRRFLVKPFAFRSFCPRPGIASARAHRAGLPLKLGDWKWTYDAQGETARQQLELTAREFELLEYLLRHKEQVVRERCSRVRMEGARPGDATR